MARQKRMHCTETVCFVRFKDGKTKEVFDLAGCATWRRWCQFDRDTQHTQTEQATTRHWLCLFTASTALVLWFLIQENTFSDHVCMCFSIVYIMWFYSRCMYWWLLLSAGKVGSFGWYFVILLLTLRCLVLKLFLNIGDLKFIAKNCF